MTADAPKLHMIYRNHRGEIAPRTIFPARLWFGRTKWHPEPQWLIHAMDLDRKQVRDFALAGILHAWPGEVPAPLACIGDPIAAIERHAKGIEEWGAFLNLMGPVTADMLIGGVGAHKDGVRISPEDLRPDFAPEGC